MCPGQMYDSPMLAVTVKMPPSLIDELEKYAQKRGLSKSEIIRRAVKHYLRVHANEIVTQRLRIYYLPKPDCGSGCGEEK